MCVCVCVCVNYKKNYYSGCSQKQFIMKININNCYDFMHVNCKQYLLLFDYYYKYVFGLYYIIIIINYFLHSYIPAKEQNILVQFIIHKLNESFYMHVHVYICLCIQIYVIFKKSWS